MLLYGASMGNSNVHTPHNLPIALIGGACGQIKGNRLVKAKFDTPFMNFGLTLLDKVGVHLDAVGDSTGRLAGI
jgi:hypothetical protein